MPKWAALEKASANLSHRRNQRPRRPSRALSLRSRNAGGFRSVLALARRRAKRSSRRM